MGVPALRATVSCALSIVFLRSVHHDPALRAIAIETNFLIPFQAACGAHKIKERQRQPITPTPSLLPS